MKLEDLLNKTQTLCRGDTYYNQNDFCNKFATVDAKIMIIDDIIITPFYLNEYTYELYDYELSILLVDKPLGINYYILSAARENNINDVPKEMVTKWHGRIIEVCKSNPFLPVSALIKYFNFVQHGEDRIFEIKDIFGDYDTDHCYFAVY